MIHFDLNPIEPSAWRLSSTASVLSVLEALIADPETGDALGDAICRPGCTAVFFECAPFTVETWQRPYDAMVIDAPALAGIAADPLPFREHLAALDGQPEVVMFESLGGDAGLVAPTPAAPGIGYAHLAEVLRDAPRIQQRALWRLTAQTALARARAAPDTPVWLSTSGLGVAWLHMRLDTRPKYYQWRDYRRWPHV